MDSNTKFFAPVCQPVEYEGPNGLRMLKTAYLYYIVRLTQFADSFFVIARKRNVSSLQVISQYLVCIMAQDHDHFRCSTTRRCR